MFVPDSICPLDFAQEIIEKVCIDSFPNLLFSRVLVWLGFVHNSNAFNRGALLCFGNSSTSDRKVVKLKGRFIPFHASAHGQSRRRVGPA